MVTDPKTLYNSYARHVKGRPMPYVRWSQVRYARELLLKDVQERDDANNAPPR